MVYFYYYDIWISCLLINAMNNKIFTVDCFSFLAHLIIPPTYSTVLCGIA